MKATGNKNSLASEIVAYFIRLRILGLRGDNTQLSSSSIAGSSNDAQSSGVFLGEVYFELSNSVKIDQDARALGCFYDNHPALNSRSPTILQSNSIYVLDVQYKKRPLSATDDALYHVSVGTAFETSSLSGSRALHKIDVDVPYVVNVRVSNPDDDAGKSSNK